MTTGYPDFRRQRDYDQFPLLVAELAAARTGNVTHGPFYVGLFHGIAGVLTVGTNPVLTEFEWKSAASGGVTTGARRFMLDPGVGDTCQFQLPNLGPFVSVTFIPLTGATNWTEQCFLWPSNRIKPVEFFPTDPLLLSLQGVAIGAGATRTDILPQYGGGPTLWYYSAVGATVTFRIDVETAPGTWDLSSAATPAAGANERDLIILPSGACRSRITNGGGAGTTVTSVLIPSYTGG